MGYRIDQKKHHHEPVRTFQDTATPSTIFVINGEISHLAIPCWYYIVEPPIEAHPHDRLHHDHVGWPSPNHPDHICQSWDFASSCCGRDKHKHVCDHCYMFIDMGKLAPIHLRKEGYKRAFVAFGDNVSGITGECEIDEKDDWIVRIVLDCKCPKAVDEKIETSYTVFVEDGSKRRDVAGTGKLTILPGPYA